MNPGLFVKRIYSTKLSKSEYKYLDLSLIDAQFLKDSITNENYEIIDSENGQCSRFRK
jgi:ABC-2 type transport system permease protein